MDEDVLNRVDELVPNAVPQEEKRRWLRQLAHRLQDLYPGGEALPWEDLGQYYLEMRIYYAQGETARYNQAAQMYRAAYNAFRDTYHRKCLPQRRSIRY